MLGEFLQGIVNKQETVDYPAMINILITHAQSQGELLCTVGWQELYLFDVADELVQFTAILWIRNFLKLSGRTMLPFACGILIAVLPCLSYEAEARKSTRFTRTLNDSLK